MFVFLFSYFLDRVTSTNLDVGDIVKVFSPSFQDLYRSEIMEVVDQVQYKVLYIDFGNMEIVPKSSIFQLSDELKNKVNYFYTIS